MDRREADALLKDCDLVPLSESGVAQAKELERTLLANDIPAVLAAPDDACCGGGGCGSKLQLFVRAQDAQRVSELLRDEWLEAVRREGTLEGLTLAPATAGATATEGDEPPCPACGFVGALAEGACSDCGLQLE